MRKTFLALLVALVLVLGVGPLYADEAAEAVTGTVLAEEDTGVVEARESKFGACNEDGTICAGPSASIFVGQYNWSNDEFDFGMIPGVGYGISIKTSPLVDVGAAVYVATKVDDPQAVDAILVISYMEYVRAGIGFQKTEGLDVNGIFVFGIGADLFQ